MLCGRMATFMPVLPWTWRPRWLRAPLARRQCGWRARARAGRRAGATRRARALHGRRPAPRTVRRGPPAAGRGPASCDAFERLGPHEGVVEGGLDAHRVVAAE